MLPSHLTSLQRVPFERGRLFDTTDLDEARDLVAPILNEPRLSLPVFHRSPRTVMDHLQVGPVSLSRLYTSASLAVDPGRLGSYYALVVPVRGRATLEVGRDAFEVAPGCAAIVSAMPKFRMVASDEFEQIIVQIDKEVVNETWATISGQAPSQPIDFATSLPMSGKTWAALEPVLNMMTSCASGAFDQLAMPSVCARLQDWLVTALLLTQPHSQALPTRDAVACAGPMYQRRAEAYMQERLAEPLALADVAAACDISPRALQASFHRAYGCGPLQWLRRRRLEAVHAALLNTQAERPSIVQIALRFGFAHLGEFSRAYRAAFHETPTETLRRRG